MTSAFDDKGVARLQQFDGKEEAWPEWRGKFEAVLESASLLDFLESEDNVRPEEAGDDQKKWDENNHKIFAKLMLGTTSIAHDLVRQFKDARDGVHSKRDGIQAWKGLITKSNMRAPVMPGR